MAPGEIRLVALGDDRFGGIQLVALGDDAAQVALLDMIWDCRPTPADALAARPVVQLRVPRSRIAESEALTQAAPPPPEPVARVDAPLTVLIAGFVATTL